MSIVRVRVPFVGTWCPASYSLLPIGDCAVESLWGRSCVRQSVLIKVLYSVGGGWYAAVEKRSVRVAILISQSKCQRPQFGILLVDCIVFSNERNHFVNLFLFECMATKGIATPRRGHNNNVTLSIVSVYRSLEFTTGWDMPLYALLAPMH